MPSRDGIKEAVVDVPASDLRGAFRDDRYPLAMTGFTELLMSEERRRPS